MTEESKNDSKESNDLTADFVQLIERPGDNENSIQRFIEQHSRFIPITWILHHDVHLNTIISKFPIGDRVADLAYLTKTSINWQLVLIELESSNKTIFKNSGDHCSPTAKFNEALDQINVWQRTWEDDKSSILASLKPLLVPGTMASNPIELKCVLIYGRHNELKHNQERTSKLADLQRRYDTKIITYDTILTQVELGRTEPRALITKNKHGYRLKSVEGNPGSMFAWIHPEHMQVPKSLVPILKDRGYNIDAWRNNHLLSVNQKQPLILDKPIKSLKTRFSPDSD